MNIGILGGTFDPIHHGHLALARAARQQFGLDRVLFIPAFNPPHKKEKNHVSSPEHRYRMVELALREEEGFEVCDLELKRKGISYTVDTLRELRESHPRAEFFLILGADAFADIGSWREPSRLGEWAVFLVAGRPGCGRKNPLAVPAKWIDMPEIPISASQIREAIGGGKALRAGMLPESVEQYARAMNLYSKDRS